MSRSVEVTILSAENLHMNKKSIKKNVFVTLQSEGSNEVSTTRVDTEGGSYPSWNEKLVIDLPLHSRFINAEVKFKTSSTCSKSVGIARIPVSDFVGGFVPENQVHFLSYRLWDSKVNRNGVVNISIRVKGSPAVSIHTPPVKGVPVTRNVSGGVVTGIPVNWF